MKFLALFVSLLLIAFLVRRSRQLSAFPWAIAIAVVAAAFGGWALWDEFRIVLITLIVSVVLVGIETFVKKDSPRSLRIKANLGTGGLTLIACLAIGGGGTWQSASHHPVAFPVILVGLAIAAWDTTKGRTARSVALVVASVFTLACFDNTLLIVALVTPEVAALISDIYRARKKATPTTTS